MLLLPPLWLRPVHSMLAWEPSLEFSTVSLFTLVTATKVRWHHRPLLVWAPASERRLTTVIKGKSVSWRQLEAFILQIIHGEPHTGSFRGAQGRRANRKHSLAHHVFVYLLRPLYPTEQIKRLIIFVSSFHSEVEVSWTYIDISWTAPDFLDSRDMRITSWAYLGKVESIFRLL